MSIPEWIVDRVSPKDPEARERSDRRFAFWVAIPFTALWCAWHLWHWAARLMAW